MESSGGVVVRALASHQCGPSLISNLVVMWVEFVGSILCCERLFPWVLQFSPLLKNLHLIKFDLINLICSQALSFKTYHVK